MTLIERLREAAGQATMPTIRQCNFTPEQIERGLQAACTKAFRIFDPGPVPDLKMRAAAQYAIENAFLEGLRQ